MNKLLIGDVGEIVKNVSRDNPNKNIVLVHGCNCHNNMGAGIALRIKNLWPQAYSADCLSNRGDVNKLGTYTLAVVEPNFVVVNLYTQYNYGGAKVNLSYEALESGLRLMVDNVNSDSVIFLLPAKIGCGLAGGDIKLTQPIIEKELINCEYYLFDI